MQGLIEAMIPAGYRVDDLRVVTPKIFKFRNSTGAPLAFYKQYAFQLRQRPQIPGGIERWDYYCLQDRSLTESTYDASKDLQAIYLSESMIFAWKHSISKREAMQTKDDWLLQQTVHQLFYKAKMHKTIANSGARTHLIYTFKPMTMRPYFPMESDYVASCPVDPKTHLQVDRLELHGCFEREYDAKSRAEKDRILRQVVQQLNASISRYIPWDDDDRARYVAAPTTRAEYFQQVRFQKLWTYQEYPQERPYPLIEMRVHDRDYGVFEALPKKDMHQAMIEAFGDKRPEMHMGDRQVDAARNKRKEKEPDCLEITFPRKEMVKFPVPPANPRIMTLFGTVAGPPPKPKLPALSKRLYAYLQTLSAQERKRLPRRGDPGFPSALRVHMRAHEEPDLPGADEEVDLFQLEKEMLADGKDKGTPSRAFLARFKDKV